MTIGQLIAVLSRCEKTDEIDIIGPDSVELGFNAIFYWYGRVVLDVDNNGASYSPLPNLLWSREQ